MTSRDQGPGQGPGQGQGQGQGQGSLDTAFARLLAERMHAYSPPLRYADLARLLGMTAAAVWGWFNGRRVVPRDPRTLFALAEIFGDPPDLWFRAAGRLMPPIVAPGAHQARTPEQDILEDIEEMRRSPFYSARAKASIIRLMEQALQGYSSREELLEAEGVVESASGQLRAVENPVGTGAAGDDDTLPLLEAQRRAPAAPLARSRDPRRDPRRDPQQGDPRRDPQQGGHSTRTAARPRTRARTEPRPRRDQRPSSRESSRDDSL